MDVGESSKQEKSKAPTKLHVTQGMHCSTQVAFFFQSKINYGKILLLRTSLVLPNSGPISISES